MNQNNITIDPSSTRQTFALEIKALKKTFEHGVEALKGINLSVRNGDFFALLGANGAGKSTTIGLISSLIKKTSGQIIINGYDLDHQTERAKISLGIVPQEINMNIFETCEQVLTVQAGYYGLSLSEALPRAHDLLKQLGLWSKCHTTIRHLSGGMKRRLMIARALMHQPSLLILDEPTAGVDIEIRRHLWKFLTKINQGGTTIILTTHYLEEAEQLCNRVAIIDHGLIIEDTSIQKLLQAIHHQTFVLTLKDSMHSLPNIHPFSATQLDNDQIEVRLDNQYTLNDLFRVLDQHNIFVHSMRNKSNRLEELFLDLIHHDK